MNIRKNSLGMLTISLVLATVAPATGADWGSLKGRLIVDGSVAAPAALNVNKDTEFCGQNKLLDETIEVGEGGGLANAFVFLYLKRGKSVDVHPDLASSGSEPAVVDNKGCRFEPHVLLLRTQQTLEIRNSDSVGHNTNFQTLSNPAFNETIPASGSITKMFEKQESYPSNVVCNIHPWMKSFVLVRDNPYMTISGADGSFEISNMPAGELEFVFWHESKGNLKDVALGEAGKTDRKGRAKLEIPAGGTLDLGDIKIAPTALGL